MSEAGRAGADPSGAADARRIGPRGRRQAIRGVASGGVRWREERGRRGRYRGNTLLGDKVLVEAGPAAITPDRWRAGFGGLGVRDEVCPGIAGGNAAKPFGLMVASR